MNENIRNLNVVSTEKPKSSSLLKFFSKGSPSMKSVSDLNHIVTPMTKSTPIVIDDNYTLNSINNPCFLDSSQGTMKEFEILSDPVSGNANTNVNIDETFNSVNNPCFLDSSQETKKEFVILSDPVSINVNVDEPLQNDETKHPAEGPLNNNIDIQLDFPNESSQILNNTATEVVESSKPTKKRRVPKQKIVNETADEQLTFQSDPLVVKPSTSEVSPENLLKIQVLTSRIKSLIEELERFENDSVMNDCNLNINSAVEKMVQTSMLELNDQSVQTFIGAIRSVIARVLQGSKYSLSDIVISASDILSSSMQIIDNTNEVISSTSDVLKEMIMNLCDKTVLSEEIKMIAVRSSLGKVPSKNVNTFENTDANYIFRWDVISPNVYFNEGEISIIKEIKSVRSKYNRIISSLFKIIELLSKSSDDQVISNKIMELEKKSSTATIDLEKYKERKLEAEKKKASDCEEKLRKEELRLQKLREKEALATKKKEDAEERQREKEAQQIAKLKVPSEKELKKQQEIQKQQNLLKSFFKTPVSASVTSVLDTSVTDLTTGNALAIVDLTSTRSVADNATRVSASFDYEAFDAVRKEGMSMSEIVMHYKQRSNNTNTVSSNNKLARKLYRKPKTVFVSINNSGTGFAENYTEIKAFNVDNRLRLLRFYEDERPAYVGTFSKKSSLLNGRNPFSKDANLFNYDYDSEAEWEAEGDDGEDIEDSDGDEESNGGDDLEYDDFLLRDNDFGSDVDSDDEVIAAALMSKNIANCHSYTMDVIGPSFSASSDCDVKTFHRLSKYESFYMVPRNLFPVLGSAATEVMEIACDGNIADAINDSKDKELKKVKEFPIELIDELALFVHGKKDGIEKLVSSFQSQDEVAATANAATADNKAEIKSMTLAIPKSQIRKKIFEIADKKRHENNHGSYRWILKSDYLTRLHDRVETVVFTPMKKRKVTEDRPLEENNPNSSICSNIMNEVQAQDMNNI